MRIFLKTLMLVGLTFSAAPAAAQDQPYQREARAVFERLISFRSSAGHEPQIVAMADYIVQTLRAGGVPEADIVRLPHGDTTALLVRLPGRDAAARPLLFSGHIDVVDARPEDWERDPFTLIEENGFFFGRGVSDNKAGITGMISTIVRMTQDRERPRRTLVFAFVGDEETTFETTRLIARHEWVRNAEFAINTDAGGGQLDDEGRPISYGVQGAEKAFASYRITVRNQGGHSSRPRPDNAIYELSEALLRVRSIRHPVRTNALTLASMRVQAASLPEPTRTLMNRFLDNPQDEEVIAQLREQPGFVVETSTTCVATMLSAGHADNALPQRAEAVVNCRIFPGETIAEVRERLAGAIANPQASVEVMDSPEVGPASEPRADVMAAITRSIHARHPGVPIIPYQEAGATDGLIYRLAGIPTYASSGIFMRQADMFAHGLNERIPIASFYESIDHVHDLARALGGR